MDIAKIQMLIIVTSCLAASSYAYIFLLRKNKSREIGRIVVALFVVGMVIEGMARSQKSRPMLALGGSLKLSGTLGLLFGLVGYIARGPARRRELHRRLQQAQVPVRSIQRLAVMGAMPETFKALGRGAAYYRVRLNRGLATGVFFLAMSADGQEAWVWSDRKTAQNRLRSKRRASK